MNNLPIFIVDSFSKIPFCGNPAAVCILDNTFQLDDIIMQKIAREMNLSETAFVKKIDNNKEIKNYFHLRWFSPTVEVPLCGHATLATAHILLTEFPHLIEDHNEIILNFQTLSGILSVKKSFIQNSIINHNYITTLQMNFPQGNPLKVQLSEDIIQNILKYFGIQRDDCIIDIWHCSVTRKLLIEVDNIQIIQNLNPSFDQLMKINFNNLNVKGIIITTKGGIENFENYDFISRYFAPWLGIPEDPVTGSAHTVLIVYWSKKLDKKKLRAFQASPRGGELYLEIYDENRCVIEGNAITVLKGFINPF
jgi:PhzF family phenazine biosynthesis protein